jgi:hypothetical protein
VVLFQVAFSLSLKTFFFLRSRRFCFFVVCIVFFYFLFMRVGFIFAGNSSHNIESKRKLENAVESSERARYNHGCRAGVFHSADDNWEAVVRSGLNVF